MEKLQSKSKMIQRNQLWLMPLQWVQSLKTEFMEDEIDDTKERQPSRELTCVSYFVDEFVIHITTNRILVYSMKQDHHSISLIQQINSKPICENRETAAEEMLR